MRAVKTKTNNMTYVYLDLTEYDLSQLVMGFPLRAGFMQNEKDIFIAIAGKDLNIERRLDKGMKPEEAFTKYQGQNEVKKALNLMGEALSLLNKKL